MSIADELLRLEQLRDRGAISPDEFARAKARVLTGAVPTEPLFRALNQFRRSTTDRWIGGVCGGLAVSTGMDSWLWRLVFALLLLAGGTGVLIYIILWIFVPLDTAAQVSQQYP
ncbi:MAG: PspC domain-containing protein [Rhodoferax sp.]|nr:PspC domain-containing protein [Rhodoferax sp.]